MRSVSRWANVAAWLILAAGAAVPQRAWASPAGAPPAWVLERAGDITRWDEALPLGNGLTGALVWGQGRMVYISLDRGDLWDLRTPDIIQRPEWTWETIQRLRAAGDFAQIHRLFDEPYQDTPYPTKLPGGRIVLIFGPGVTISRFTLSLARGEATVALTGAEVRVRMDAVLGIGVVTITGAQPAIMTGAPSGVDRLGYARAAVSHTPGEWTLRQEAAAGLSYAVVMRQQPVTATRARYAVAIEAEWGGRRDPLVTGRARAASALRIDEAAALARHLDWWARFWAISSIQIPDARLQRHYDLVKYLYGAASRPDAPPIPLQGVWTADEGNLPPWKGDYHHDLNTQMTYLAYPEAGLFDQGASFLNQLWRLLPRFREFGRSFYGVSEALVPGVMAADGQPLGGWAQYSLSPTNSAWLAQSFYLHWKYTADATFLRDRAYPWCAEVGRGLRGLLHADMSGRLKLPLSSSPEIFDNSTRAWLTPNSNYDLALMRFLFGANAEMADALGDHTAARGWQETLAHLDPLLIDRQTSALMMAEGIPFDQSHRHFSHAMAIYPLGTLTVEGTAGDRRTIAATLDGIAAPGTKQWCGYSFSWFAAMAARAGQPDRALTYLRDYERAFTGPNGFHLNGDQTRSGLSSFTYRPFTLEGNFLAMQAVHEMLLQSWGGVVRVFPSVSHAWADVSFDRLRAEGGWIVSASRTGGRTARVEIQATAGGTLRLRDPFGNGAVTWSRADVKKDGGEYVVTLRAGEVLTGTDRRRGPGGLPTGP